jgi:hypothetical protein
MRDLSLAGFWGDAFVGDEFEQAEHHFIGGLQAETDGAVRVGVGRVVGGVVVAREDVDARARGHEIRGSSG